MESISGEISVSQNANEGEVKESNQEQYDYVYCTVCYNDQPLRAKHCKQCGTCIAMFDHHCPFVDNCIGERNKLIFFWYIFFQCFECILTCGLLINNTKDESDFETFWKVNYMYILASFCPFLIGILLLFLWIYHLVLACKGITTFEMIKWKEIHYLGSLRVSPFNKSILKNLIYYCKPFKGMTLWRVQ